MDIAIIKDNICVNVAVFDDIDTAQQFLADGVFGEADLALELPDGYGIGDKYMDGAWEKKESVAVLAAAHSEDEDKPAKRWFEKLFSFVK